MSSKGRGLDWEGLNAASYALDKYLSTDDEEDEDSSFHPKKARNGCKKDAQQQAELAQAKRVAHRRMERQEIMEIERAFAALDNVREGAGHLRESRYSKSKSQLNPLQNPFIENEAAEVRDSDSDLADEESFDSLISSSQPDTSTEEEEDLMPSPPISQNQSISSGFDQEDCPILYENYSASRKQMEAQIQQEQMLSKGHQSGSDSTSSNGSYQHSDSASASDTDEFSYSNISGNDSETSMELEASFSSVAG